MTSANERREARASPLIMEITRTARRAHLSTVRNQGPYASTGLHRQAGAGGPLLGQLGGRGGGGGGDAHA
jgi:hypothetical protein